MAEKGSASGFAEAGVSHAELLPSEPIDLPTVEIMRFAVRAETSLRDAMQRIDLNGAGIAIVVGADLTCIDVVTDGDIRRAILNHIDLSQPISKVLEAKRAINSRRAVTARIDDPPEFVLLLMERFGIHQVPLLDSEGRLRKVVHRDALSSRPRLSPGHAAVIMAGGYGMRLRPLTEKTAKPMLRVAGRPILEHTVRLLVQQGIERIHITVHYRAEDITEYFGNGARFGAEIEYIHEATPLGTAGSIRAARPGGRPLLVMNGDVMTHLNFPSFFDFHRKNAALVTVAAAPYEVGVPYGVIDVEGVNAVALEEKPTKRFFINTGIYVLSPEACEMIPGGKVYNMTDLIDDAMRKSLPVKVYAMHEYWRDIGRIEDLQRVNMELSRSSLAS